MIASVLLDLDDVCNEMTPWALRWLGVPFDGYDDFYANYQPKYGYDIVANANDMLGYRRFTPRLFWSMLPREFWASCPPSADFEDLLRAIVGAVGYEDVIFLTKPTKCPDSLSGKLDWIKRHAPAEMHRQYSVTPRKRFSSNPEALLIDDCEENVNEFRERGGQALLVPRPWNSNRRWGGVPFLETLREILN